MNLHFFLLPHGVVDVGLFDVVLKEAGGYAIVLGLK